MSEQEEFTLTDLLEAMYYFEEDDEEGEEFLRNATEKYMKELIKGYNKYYHKKIKTKERAEEFANELIDGFFD